LRNEANRGRAVAADAYTPATGTTLHTKAWVEARVRRAATKPRIPDRPGNGKGAFAPILDPESSANLRDQLVREIAGLNSADAAAEWARSALPAKNTLISSDAWLVQVAFELRLSALEPDARRPHTTDRSRIRRYIGYG
jgi:hypothetical protein